MTPTVSRRRVVAAVATTLLVGALAGWATGPGPVDPPDSLRLPGTPQTSRGGLPPAPAPAAPAPVPTTTARTGGALPPTSAPAPPSAPPTRLEVPRLGARMPVRPVGVDRRGEMALPPDPAVAGWYRFGAAPGTAAGATVIAAHVDDATLGTGPLARLDRLRRGDPVVLRTGASVYRYRVTSVLLLAKGDLDVEELFTRVGPARLHLVTCGGAFDAATGHYEDNVVVVAEPVQEAR